MGAAREKVRVARALEQLPKIAAAMENGGGEVSSSRREAGAGLSPGEGRRGVIARGAAVCRPAALAISMTPTVQWF